MAIKNKYEIEISSKMVYDYYKNLIGQFYKILPIYEEQSYGQFQKYINNFIVEICGGYYLFNDSQYFLILLNTLEGINQIELDNHSKLKSLIFKCIDICNKLIKEVGEVEL